jgi:galactokinase
MTGGGFGGSVVCLCAPERVPSLRKRILPAYREAWSLDAALRELHPVDGARGWHLEKHA